MRRARVAVLAMPAVVVLAGIVVSPATPPVATSAPAAACPPGFLREPIGGAHPGYAALGRALDAAQRAAGHSRPCVRVNRPEPLAEIGDMASQRLARLAAPTGRIPAGAYRQAIAQKATLAASGATVAGANGTWTPLGTTPLIGDEPGYDSVNGEGMTDLAGRIDSLDYDPVHHRVFATVGTGGVWMSDDLGDSWRSISDTMPTQTVGAVGWTSAGGSDGTVVVVGGEPLMGGDTNTGLGAFYTRDLGRTWQHSSGVPDGVMGFQIAVDRSNPSTVYAATSMGLWRSTDGGASFVNTKLPTSAECAGSTAYDSPCEFANFVTDVVVVEPGGRNTDTPAGTVVAAVGYRAGMATFPNGKVQSPGNGIYRSATGAPGTFQKLDVSSGIAPASFAPQDHIGRVEMGAATGPDQDHDYLYAIVQDAVLFNGGAPVIDVPDDPTQQVGLPYNTVFNGVYVSSDFGRTWTRMADDNEVSENPATGSALAGLGQATLYAPGVQSWYDEWIHPDPTRQDANGVPTRLAFGLEEVWQNRLDGPQDATEAANPSSFVVVGPYYSGDSCQMLSAGLPSCPTTGTGSGDTTTHPDQQDGLWLPDTAGGGVSLLVGNDGGAFRQHAAPGAALTSTGWGRGRQSGFHTLLAYDGEPAKDGTVWFGLQDNGSGKITPQGRQIEAYGGDGFYTAVNPSRSDEAYEEYTYGDIRVTTDGGKSWRSLYPPISNGEFANQFAMDPTDPNHLITAGPEVVETTYGPQTSQMDPTESQCLSSCWQQVFDIGSANQMSAIDLQGDASYVGWCGACDVLNNWGTGFHRGIATNVGGSAPARRMTSAGWHQAAAKGLPNRYVTSIAIDPKDPRTVFVTLGGYNNREWVPPGSYLDSNNALGSGHVFVSHDAAATFTDISGSLPDTEATWVELHGSQLVVGTDIGAFLSSDREGTRWAPLTGLPTVPVSTIRTSPADANTVVVATFGRGIWSYTFPVSATRPTSGKPSGSGTTPVATPVTTPVANGRPVTSGALASTGLPVAVPVVGLALLVAAALTRRRGRAG